MSAPPIAMVYQGGGVFHASGRFVTVAEQYYGHGEVVVMGQVDERSEISHSHQFAWLKDAWLSLPESIAAEFPTSEHLRKRALINTGWCDVQDYPTASKAEAIRTAAILRGVLDDYAVVIIRDAVVRVCRAKSQARGKMTPADFQASKDAVLNYVAHLLEVDPETLSAAAQGAGGANNPVREAAA